MKEMQALYPLSDVNLSEANALQHLSQPLLKNKVYAMTHKKESYAGKWRAMKEKRERTNESRLHEGSSKECNNFLNASRYQKVKSQTCIGSYKNEMLWSK